MKILTVTLPGAEGARDAVSASLADWNRGIDIRLRFLNIGIEETRLDLEPGADIGEDCAVALERVETAIARERPVLILLHGGGAPALSVAVTAAKATVPLFRTSAGMRGGPFDGEERGADRLATVRMAAGSAALAELVEENLGEGSSDPGSPGSPGWEGAVARAVVRILRER
jgi:hypothetical protein